MSKIEEAQKALGYKTAKEYEDDIIKNINFDSFGGRQNYFRTRDVYWYRIFNEKSYFDTAVKFNLPEDEVKKMCNQFEDYLNAPVHYYDRD